MVFGLGKLSYLPGCRARAKQRGRERYIFRGCQGGHDGEVAIFRKSIGAMTRMVPSS